MAVKNQMAVTDCITSWIAGAAIEKYDCVKLDTTEGQVIKTASANDIGIGFALNAADTAGDSVDIQMHGIARARTATTVALGASVYAIADGEVGTVASSNNTLYHCIGQAASAAGSGGNEIISVVINPHTTYTHA